MFQDASNKLEVFLQISCKASRPGHSGIPLMPRTLVPRELFMVRVLGHQSILSSSSECTPESWRGGGGGENVPDGDQVAG